MPIRNRKSSKTQSTYGQLNPRQMLASVTFNGGYLNIVGTDGNDSLVMLASSDDGSVQLYENDTLLESLQAAEVEHISFFGVAGDDSLEIHGHAFIADSGYADENLFTNLKLVRFFGGDGDDSFVLRFNDFSGLAITGIGGLGNDRFHVNSTTGAGDEGIADEATVLRFYGNDGNDDLRSKGLSCGFTRLIGGSGDDLLVGGRADDFILGGEGADKLFGGDGNDQLIGGAGADELDGQSGDDYVIDNFGDDLLVGGDGDDWIFGGSGNDSVVGGVGADQLLGGDGSDYLAGFSGADRIFGGNGADRIHGGSQDDFLMGADGEDVIFGNGGNDKIYGESGNDSVFGGEGDDILLGGIGADTMHGEAGDDVMFGGAGDDELYGHQGADFLDGGSNDDRLNVGIDVEDDRAKGGFGADLFTQIVGADRLLDYTNGFDLRFFGNDLTDGVRKLESRAAFDVLARRENFPGAIQAQEVKFLITGADTGSPELHFINSNTRDIHYLFWNEVLGQPGSLQEFNLQTYFTNAGRKNISGSIVAHDSFVDGAGVEGLFTMEIWPTDPIAFRFANTAFNLIADSAPWMADKLAFHRSSETIKDAISAEQSLYDASNVRMIDTNELYGNLEYQPMNQAETFGRLILATGSTVVTARDIPIFTSLPNDLSTVSGIITSVPQTPLSHVNLKATQNNTPNAFVKDATTHPDLVPFINKLVYFSVGPDGFEIREATQEEVELHFESVRPSEPQFPARDLSETAIKALPDFGFADTDSYGAKAANVAELQHIMPGIAPEGFAIPYSYYDAYMKANGFYEEAQAMMDDALFQSNPEEREDMLKDFRKRIKKSGEMPEWITEELTKLQGSFADGITPRLRSSANAEDLVGFSGAGLYDSFTHKEDEGHISKSVKQVWASLWNYRAFEEREFFRVDHLASAMGVLVHPNYKDELANGVGVTKNIFDPYLEGHYVNVQIGEDLVTNPDLESIPEEFLVAKLYGFRQYETQYIRSTNQLPAGERVLTSNEILELREKMDEIRAHFAPLYGRSVSDDSFGMEIEFKITAEGNLAIKQARPWVG